MSADNVARFREATALVNRGDWDGFIEMAHPDVVWIPLRAPVQGSYLGHEGLRRFVADTLETFDVFTWHEEEIHDLGDRLLAVGTLRLRGSGSHIETEVPAPTIVTYEDGLVTRFESFPDRQAAMRAAGLA